MDFGLSQDQQLLDETLRAFLADQVPIDRVRTLRDAACPNDRAIWKALAELGATGILVPEAEGGSALGLLDAAVVAQAIGYAVTPVAFLSSAVIAPVAFREMRASGPGASDAELSEWLGGIAAGDLVVGVGLTECFSVREDAGVREAGGALHGKAMMVIDGCGADLLLLAVGSESTAAGAGAFAVVDARGPGVETTRLVTTDLTRCTAEIMLDGARPIAFFEDGRGALARALDAGRIALAAEAFGACESMVEQAVRYAGQRKQFDRLIGSFQAVKHMCAEMVAELEPTRSLLWYAAHAFDAVPQEAPMLACHVLAHSSEIGREIASVSTQVHGGIGWTDEQNLHFRYKRIAGARHLLGGPEFLRERAASLQSFDRAS